MRQHRGLHVLWITENSNIITCTLFSVSTILIMCFIILPCLILLILCIWLWQCPVQSGIGLKAWKSFHFACSALYFITSKIPSLSRSIKMNLFSPSSAVCQIVPPDEAACSARAALETSPATLGREEAGAAPQPSTPHCCEHCSALASLGAPSAFKEDKKMEGWGGNTVLVVNSPLI